MRRRGASRSGWCRSTAAATFGGSGRWRDRDRFAGATYDPTSHYRAAAVFDFFAEQALDPVLLREVSRHQIEVLASAFDALDLDPAIVSRGRDIPLGELGGFLALRSPAAPSLARGLHQRGVLTDARGEVLRLGPAPYLCDRQLLDAVGILGEVAREGAGGTESRGPGRADSALPPIAARCAAPTGRHPT